MHSRIQKIETAGFILLLLALILMLFAGCDILGSFLPRPTTTSVQLRNDGDFTVDVELYTGDEQDAPRLALTTLGDERDFSIEPGEMASFSLDCEDLQAIVIEDADLRVIVGAGPETDSDVLRDGTDFACGDTIVFTFDHGPTIVDFDVQWNVVR